MSDYALKTTVSPEYMALIEKVSTLVHKISGNKLGEKQAFMIETRLRKRMLEVGLRTPAEYMNYIDKNIQRETGILVGLITTHHTFFFREFTHFELLKKMLPDLVMQVKKRGEKTMKVWSAACSRGQEVYSLAMFLDHYLPQIDPTMNFSILGSDIDEESIKIAANGVYHQNEIKEVPMNFLSNHWAHGTGDIAMYAKVKDSLKKRVHFKKGNLMTPHETADTMKFDVIFCRNVFIYFEQHQIEKICNELMKFMYPDGLFFSGISESLTGYKIDFTSIGPSAYKLKGSEGIVKNIYTKEKERVGSGSISQSIPVTNTMKSPEIYKVLCVDDSQSIHTLLKKILSKEEGFEIVGHAMNGKEAMEMMKTLKVDVVTLDIHMPVMDGISYLTQNMDKNHPPVVMISSASREDADTAIKALKLGASDFVEKPSLQNLEEKGDEIRTKLKTVVSDRMMNFTVSSYDLESSKKIIIDDPSYKLRIILATIVDMKRVKELLKQCDGVQPATIIFFEGHGELLEVLINENMKDFKMKLNYVNDANTFFRPGEVYFADMKKCFIPIAQKHSKYKVSILCFGMVSKNVSEMVLNWKNAQLLLEDLGVDQNNKSPLKEVATDVVPMTSFNYMSNVFFTKK